MSSGQLYIVPTPIGNLADVTFRAIDTLKSVDTILAEDTRHSKRLLDHYDIQTPLTAYHEHNEKTKTEQVLMRLQKGENLALISDAGTPLISDPGFPLIKSACEAGIRIVPLPGPCAAITALSAAGLATHRFSFHGFLPTKSSGRQEKLSQIANESGSQIFYESSHRIVALFEDIQTVYPPDRPVVLAKELTKTHETIIKASAEDILAWLNDDERRKKGEFVVIIEGAAPKISSELCDEALRILDELLLECPLKQAVALAVKITGEKKNALYEAAVNRR